jgi:hypothetical protein
MTHPKTRARTGAALLGVVLAAASAGLATADTHSRTIYRHRRRTTTVPTTTAPGGSPSPNGPAEAAASCGIERWDVKTGTDAAVGSVNQAFVKQTTIAALDAIPAPANPMARVAPVEDTVYQITGTLSAYKIEADSDYHLALDDGQGHTMIAEIPAPNCVSAGPFKVAIAQARQTFDSQFQATGSYQSGGISVSVTGVGFFDRIHGQRGVAPNGIELHPVLALQFGP